MPIPYFWIAQYKDGQALPQFDPVTGVENLFKDIDQSNLIRFGLYPFSSELSAKVSCSISNPLLEQIVINLDKDDKLVFLRRNYIQRSRNKENRFMEYLLGTQNYILYIDGFGNIEVKKEI